METFMSILFVLSIALISISGVVIVWAGLIFFNEWGNRYVEKNDILILSVCVVLGFGGYIAAINIDDYQAQMKVDKFKITCVLEGSEGRFNAVKKNAVVKIDGDIEVELTSADWTLRIGDEMLNAASVPKCAGVSK